MDIFKILFIPLKMKFIFISALHIFCNYNISIVWGKSNSIFDNKVFYLNQGTAYHGTLQNMSDVTSLQECSSICLKEEACEAILFDKTKPTSSKCYLITYGVNAIDIGNMDGYSYFTKGECMGIPTPDIWDSGCPQLYLNMENIHGGVILGMSPPEFEPNGKIGLMFHHPTANNTGFGFGWYTGTEHCFSQPKYCNEGVSYAVWVNLLGDIGNLNNHFFGTGGHKSGFVAGWDTTIGLYVIASNNDTSDEVFFPSSQFMSDYGYNNWIHCVFVYKYGAATPGSSDIKMYLNGIEKNTTRMSVTSSAHDSTFKYLLIGNSHMRMNMDEFLVWQKMLSSEEIKKLYDAYQ